MSIILNDIIKMLDYMLICVIIKLKNISDYSKIFPFLYCLVYHKNLPFTTEVFYYFLLSTTGFVLFFIWYKALYLFSYLFALYVVVYLYIIEQHFISFLYTDF